MAIEKIRIGPGKAPRFRYQEDGAEAVLETFEDGFAYLEDIWAEPGSRRAGVGRRLLHNVEDDARRMGAKELGCHPKAYERGATGTISPRPEFDQALGDWYRKSGWEPNGRDDENVKANRGTWMKALRDS